MNYATGTSVSADRSKAEIEAILRRYGADQFVAGWRDSASMLGFRVGNRMVRFVLPLPTVADMKTYKLKRRGYDYTRTRSEAAAAAACDQETRRRFRALALVIKAKLEAVSTGITTFEEEFLAHLVLPGGMTVYEQTRKEIAHAYDTGKPPELLLGFGGGGK